MSKGESRIAERGAITHSRTRRGRRGPRPSGAQLRIRVPDVGVGIRPSGVQLRIRVPDVGVGIPGRAGRNYAFAYPTWASGSGRAGRNYAFAYPTWASGSPAERGAITHSRTRRGRRDPAERGAITHSRTRRGRRDPRPSGVQLRIRVPDVGVGIPGRAGCNYAFAYPTWASGSPAERGAITHSRTRRGRRDPAERGAITHSRTRRGHRDPPSGAQLRIRVPDAGVGIRPSGTTRQNSTRTSSTGGAAAGRNSEAATYPVRPSVRRMRQ